MTPEEQVRRLLEDSIRFQRRLVADLGGHAEGRKHLKADVEACIDPDPRSPTAGQVLTVGEVFDQHALCLQVMWEVELRALKRERERVTGAAATQQKQQAA